MSTITPDTPRNLDYLAAKHAQGIIKETGKVKKASDVENAVTKTLGVLQENGVYACFVFALSRAKNTSDEGKVMQAIVKQLLALLYQLGYKVPNGETLTQLDPGNILDSVTENVTHDLERLLLAKEVLEQTLIYARYGAKARPDTTDPQHTTGASS